MLLQAVVGASVAVSPIIDVRVGDDGTIARIEIVCAGPCSAEPTGEGDFLVVGATAQLWADTTQKSDYLRTIQITAEGAGARLSVESAIQPRAVFAGSCGAQQLCFDYEFTERADGPVTITLDSLSAEIEELAAMVPPATTSSEAPTEGDCETAQRALDDDAWNMPAFELVEQCATETAGLTAPAQRMVSHHPADDATALR